MLTVFIIIAVLIASLLVYASMRPAEFRTERSAGIKAPPEKILPFITDFHDWTGWSPWEKVDSALKRTYSGAASGKGAVYEWEGNSKVGKGRMEITDVAAPSSIIIKLDFEKPMRAHNIATFTLEPQGDTTRVTWAMSGRNAFMGKLMCVFMNMDRMVGKDFEAGLANLKVLAEQ